LLQEGDVFSGIFASKDIFQISLNQGNENAVGKVL